MVHIKKAPLKAPEDFKLMKAAKKVMKELPDDLLGDMHASADYRRAMSQVFVERALTAAAARAKK